MLSFVSNQIHSYGLHYHKDYQFHNTKGMAKFKDKEREKNVSLKIKGASIDEKMEISIFMENDH